MFAENIPEDKFFKILLFILLIFAGLLSITNYQIPFVYDDLNQIVGNYNLRDLSNIKAIIHEPNRPQRFIQNITLAFNWAVSQEKTWSYHLFNNLLHLLNTFLLIGLLRRVGLTDRFVISTTVLLFFLHPLQVESVSYVMGRSELLKTLFTFSILNLYLSHKRNKLLIYLFLVAGLLAKETCILIPFMFLALDITVLHDSDRRSGWKEHLFYFSHAIWAWPFNKVFTSVAYAGTTGFDLFPFWDYIVTNLHYLIYYIYLFFNPSEQSIIHEWASEPPLLTVIAGVILYITMGFLILNQRKNKPVEIFMIILFLVSFLPHNSIFQYINPFAEYRLYQSNAVLTFFLAWILAKMKLKRSLMKVISLSFIFYFAVFHYLYLSRWQNPLNLWGYANLVYPKSFNTNLGLYHEYQKLGLCTNAERHLEKACQYSRFEIENLKCKYGWAVLEFYRENLTKSLDIYNEITKNYPFMERAHYRAYLLLLERFEDEETHNKVLTLARQVHPGHFTNFTYDPSSAQMKETRLCLSEEKELELEKNLPEDQFKDEF